MLKYFALGFLIYCLSSYISFYQPIKDSKYFLPVGMGLAIIANLAWLFLTRSMTDTTKILLIGMYWDLMLTLIYLLIPFIFFHVNLSTTQYCGIITIVFGIILTKL